MKRKTKQIFRYVSFLLVLLMLFASCGNDQGKETGSTEGGTTAETIDDGVMPSVFPYALSEFQLVRPDNASSTVTDAAIQLNRTIKEYLGKSLRIKTDFEADDEIACEIIIGDTTRVQSQEVLATLEAGDYTIQSVKTADGVKIVICGYSDTLTEKAIAEFEALLQANAVEESGQIKSFALKTNLYDLYSDFTLNIGDPILVAEGGTYAELGWGPYQFPKLYYTTSGSILCEWHMSNDQIHGGVTFEGASRAVSDDGGLTWREATSSDKISYTRSEMSNGNYFVGFSGQGTHVAEYISKYSAIYTQSGVSVYYAKTLKELDKTVYARVYNPSTGAVTAFECTINWPYAPISVYSGNVVYPISSTMSISNGLGDLATDDALYFCTYTHGFDLETGEATKYDKYYSIYVFKSTDNAHTWDCISRVAVTEEVFNASKNYKGSFEGFCEPMMSQMPDGSIVMLMRTGGNQPSYLVRSTDGCQTWSDPVIFDDVGVLPQIITLECGVSLASYGRDGMYMRATSDHSGLEWEDSIQIPLSKFGSDPKSCYYTYFLALDDHTVLWVYSDFYYKTNKTADATKCVMARIITVEPKTE
ncbi:MAG: hypothetical protein IJW55_04615 [Clostridia bacterium]|nr:hypothetical protein [Clostridia bacterium]